MLVPCCVTVGKPLSLSDPQILYLEVATSHKIPQISPEAFLPVPPNTSNINVSFVVLPFSLPRDELSLTTETAKHILYPPHPPHGIAPCQSLSNRRSLSLLPSEGTAVTQGCPDAAPHSHPTSQRETFQLACDESGNTRRTRNRLRGADTLWVGKEKGTNPGRGGSRGETQVKGRQ